MGTRETENAQLRYLVPSDEILNDQILKWGYFRGSDCGHAANHILQFLGAS